jgi:hypothetical protein
VPDAFVVTCPPGISRASPRHACGAVETVADAVPTRRLHQDAARPAAPMTVEDLKAFSARFGDLDDREVMRRAYS